jgi:hypothetical protein
MRRIGFGLFLQETHLIQKNGLLPTGKNSIAFLFNGLQSFKNMDWEL